MTDAAVSEKAVRGEMITVRVEPELMMWVRAVADREARSVGGYVRALLIEKRRESEDG